MTCGIRKHIEDADDALRKAIITALENKQDEQLDTLFEALGKVRELILTTPIRFTDNTTDYFRNKAEYNFNLESDIDLNTGGYKIPADVITFPTDYTGVTFSSSTDDTIVSSGDYDQIYLSSESEGLDARHGKDLDKLDGPE
tara:strand:- start:253 stop:678 length:426 start_codon:yes stop_codon:yes gene_type:complete